VYTIPLILKQSYKLLVLRRGGNEPSETNSAVGHANDRPASESLKVWFSVFSRAAIAPLWSQTTSRSAGSVSYIYTTSCTYMKTSCTLGCRQCSRAYSRLTSPDENPPTEPYHYNHTFVTIVTDVCRSETSLPYRPAPKDERPVTRPAGFEPQVDRAIYTVDCNVVPARPHDGVRSIRRWLTTDPIRLDEKSTVPFTAFVPCQFSATAAIVARQPDGHTPRDERNKTKIDPTAG